MKLHEYLSHFILVLMYSCSHSYNCGGSRARSTKIHEDPTPTTSYNCNLGDLEDPEKCQSSPQLAMVFPRGITILPRGHSWAIDGGDADSKVSPVGAISHHGQMRGSKLGVARRC